MRTSTTGNWSRSSGFTLIELTVVVLILSVLAGMTATYIGPMLFSSTLKSETRELVRSLSSCRMNATLRKESMEFVLDLDNNQWWSGSLEQETAKGQEAKVSQQHAPKVHTISEAVRLVSVQVEAAETRRKGKVRLFFSPKGLTLPATVQLAQENEESMTLYIPSFSPKLTVREGLHDLKTMRSAQ